MKTSQNSQTSSSKQNVKKINDKITQWLCFIEEKSKPKTKIFSVWSNCDKTKLGEIKWYSNWRHYCFFPSIDKETVYSDRCLIEISQFITKLNGEHKQHF